MSSSTESQDVTRAGGPAAESWALDACALLEAYRRVERAPTDVLAELLARIASAQPLLNAYSHVDDAGSLHEQGARSAARWRAGSPCGPLDGVPMVIKDNLTVRGMPASWGNAELARRVVGDELPVERLRTAGAIVLGKGNVPEFAVEGYTANARYGVTRNPFDAASTPGGSSGGVASAVAAGLATAGLGTDGGGSIRRPAGYCGLVGLKPGIGRVPRVGGLPQVLLDFEVAGPLTRSVRDAALLDAVLSGPDVRDPASRGTLPAHFDPDRADDARPRVLIVRRLGDAPVDPRIVVATERAAATLEGLGCRMSAGELPLELSALSAAWTRIGEIGLARLFDADPAVGAAAAPKYRDMAARGRRASALELWSIHESVTALRAAAVGLFATLDMILLPTSAAMPWPADEPFPPRIDGRPAGSRGHAVYTGWVNAAGLPALALPAPASAGELPIGVQLVGNHGTERTLLALGVRHEAVVGGFAWPEGAASFSNRAPTVPSPAMKP